MKEEEQRSETDGHLSRKSAAPCRDPITVLAATEAICSRRQTVCEVRATCSHCLEQIWMQLCIDGHHELGPQDKLCIGIATHDEDWQTVSMLLFESLTGLRRSMAGATLCSRTWTYVASSLRLLSSSFREAWGFVPAHAATQLTAPSSSIVRVVESCRANRIGEM